MSSTWTLGVSPLMLGQTPDEVEDTRRWTEEKLLAAHPSADLIWYAELREPDGDGYRRLADWTPGEPVPVGTRLLLCEATSRDVRTVTPR